MTDKATSPAIGYIYLAYGNKMQFRRNRQKLPGFAKQAGRVNQHAAHRGLKIRRWFIDHNTSRKASVFDQGQFAAALFEAEQDGIPVVVADFFHLASRYAPAEALARIAQLRRHPTKIIDATSTFAIQTLSDKALQFWLNQACKASNLHSVAVRRGRKAAQTSHAGKGDRSERSAPRRGPLLMHGTTADDHAVQIERLVNQIRPELPQARRENCAAIARILNDRGVRSRTGRPWSRQQVRRTLNRANEIGVRRKSTQGKR